MGYVKLVRGNIQDYLGMITEFTKEGDFKIDMKYCIKGMFENPPYEIKATKTTARTEKLLKA